MDLLGGGINAYPIGSYYFTSDARNPSEILGGGTWEKLEQGRFLMASGDGYPVGSKGGEATHTLTESEMPSHSHNGDAELSGSTQGAGGHSHSRGTMRIQGGDFASPYTDDVFGAFYYDGETKGVAGGISGSDGRIMFDTNNDTSCWTGSTSSAGAHTHSLEGVTASITTDSAGSGNAHNNLPPYMAVNIWRRTA